MPLTKPFTTREETSKNSTLKAKEFDEYDFWGTRIFPELEILLRI